MFILYALPIGLAAGLLTGGRLDRLGQASLRWAPLALLGLAVQLVVFFGPVADRIGALGVPLYVGSTLLVLVAVLRNLGVPGMALVAAGAAANLAAIAANGGYMPASADALAALGKEVGSGYSNSASLPDPALAPLTDLFAMPAWLPFANVFSVGDVLIAAGVALALGAALHGPRPGVRRGNSTQSTEASGPTADGADPAFDLPSPRR
jgi:hypothetical protein